MPDLDLSREACERRINDALLEITNHPERWDQGVYACVEGATLEGLRETLSRHEWPCNTFACLAGTVVIQAGYTEPEGPDIRLHGACYLVINKAGQRELRDHPWYQRSWNNNNKIDFGGLAALLCGLGPDQSGQIFDSDNTLRLLWELAARFTDGRITLPAELDAVVTNIDNERAPLLAVADVSA